ncbi:MAG: heme-degrading monooxygenase HmoA [Spirosomataceae bacterium]|jgi:heme-degrading monooxygenase HmoA
MIVALNIVKYSKSKSFLGILSMAFFRLPLMLNKNVKFWKLMGCGKNGTFDVNPDWQQWALMTVWENEADYQNFNESSFITRWWKKFTDERTDYLCTPYESHGKWDGKEPFGNPKPDRTYTGPIAVLTRATIRLSKAQDFWKNVPKVAGSMDSAEGFITSVGIGEVPFIKQATFSVWKDLESVKKFAYRQREHADVVKQTRTKGWYSEELFARFIPIEVGSNELK